MHDPSDLEFLETLSSLRLFSRMTPDEAHELMLIARREERQAGQLVFDEGTRAPGLYLLSRGKVEIRKQTGDGLFHTLAYLQAPSFFGEMSFITGQSTVAQAVALEPMVCFLLGKEEFDQMLEVDKLAAHKTLAAIARMLANRLRAMDEEVVRLLAELPNEKREAFAQLKARFFTEFDS